MFKSLNGIRLVRFEPEYHTSILYAWYYSGDYSEFYRHWPQCPSAAEIANAAVNNTFMAVLESNNTIVGMVRCYHEVDTSRNFFVGVVIDKQFEKQGLGITALKIFLNWKFNYCNFYKAKLNIMARNKRIISILELFGASREGGEGAVFKKDVFLNGEFHDTAVYAVFKTDFNKRYKQEFEPSEARLEAPRLEVDNVRGFRGAIQAVPGADVRAAG